MRAAALLASCCLVLGCGGDDEPPPPEPVSFTLASGTEVAVSSTGRLSITRDGRRLLTTAEGERPVARTFDAHVEMQLGGFTFRRTGVDERVFGRYTGAVEREGAVELSFEGPGGAAATLRVLDEGDESTRVALGASGATSLALPLECAEGDAFFGFGAQYDVTDQRGHSFPLWVSEQGIGRTGGALPWVGNAHTTYFPVPFWLDAARGVGILVDTSSRVLVDLCESDERIAWIEVEHGVPLELVVFHGPTAYDVIRELGDRVGRPAAPPTWAWRPWVAVQGGRDALLAEADALDAAGVPYGALWAQDWSGRREFAPGSFGVAYQWVPDDALYPDFAGLTAELHARGVRYLGYANPFVIPELAHFDEMRDRGLLIGAPDGSGPYLFASLNGDSSMPDTTDPEAREYVKQHLRAMLETHGMDGFMSDFGEWLPTDARLDGADDAFLYHNLYATEWHRLAREAMDEARPDGDYVLFSRSGWTGEHEVAQIVWIGDQETDFTETDGLPTVVPALLNLGMTGIPFVTHDIAGFSGGPSTKELYLRWTELGAFTPIMRTHEGIMREANWDWNSDAETIAHFARLARVHEALIPEIEALAAEAAATGKPLVRHLVLEHPNDPEARAVDDQFLLGPDLLVAPVVTEGATERSVYLPEGEWFHVWTGERHAGSQRITVPAPIGSPPVFSRGVDRADLRAIE